MIYFFILFQALLLLLCVKLIFCSLEYSLDCISSINNQVFVARKYAEFLGLFVEVELLFAFWNAQIRGIQIIGCVMLKFFYQSAVIQF